jgi:hypothetical protein
MVYRKKLQVFISSTYLDLKEERQAAVEAILTAGHIPAGMELFKAGDETQMNVIKRWIDESDVYLLILGMRYGSVESLTKKSYIHLEYEYAVVQGKPLFAVVVAEDKIEEQAIDHPQKLREFRELVLSRMVKFWRDSRDIKLSILETMSEFAFRSGLTGWIPGSEAVNSGALAEEIARLTKENAELRELVAKSTAALTRYNGLSFEEMHALLRQAKLDTHAVSVKDVEKLKAVAQDFGDEQPSVLHLFWMMRGHYNRAFTSDQINTIASMRRLQSYGLVDVDADLSRHNGGTFFKLTESGIQFLLRLRLEHENDQ